MAVFTPLSLDECKTWFCHPEIGYDLGEVVALQGIRSGIENSNFFVTLKSQQGGLTEWVLTLFERISEQELPFYLNLQLHLAQRGVCVPAPQKNHCGELFAIIKNRPAALVTKLKGQVELAPSASHCRQMGENLAEMHLAVHDFGQAPPNPRGLAWWRKVVPDILPFLPPDQADLLQDELVSQEGFAKAFANLPPDSWGAVHADAFRDNVMFEDGCLSGVFDFYFAGFDCFLFDLAVVANDWCVERMPQLTPGQFEPGHITALLQGYEKVRPLSRQEKELWPLALRTATMRFWVSRLYDWHLPRDAQMLKPHDPRYFETMLRAYRAAPQNLVLH